MLLTVHLLLTNPLLLNIIYKMRDFKISVIEDYGLDLDFVDGEAAYVGNAGQTQDQRASLAVYCTKGTVPGQAEYGVSWADQYNSDTSPSQLSNECQMQVQNEAGSSTSAIMGATMYNAMLVGNASKGYGVMVMRGK